MPILAFRNVNKTYNPGLFKKKIQAVQNLSLDILEGEVFGLIGPNGAGKSTTIRLLLGLMRPDDGTIEFRGRPIAGADLQRSVGYLPENPYLYDHLTLDELLAFCGQASGLSKDQICRRSQSILERMAMTGARKRPVRTFSKGMLQRAGICFALLHDPSIVILDEPMSGLDPIGRRMVFDLVADLKADGKTVFFCSHILTDVEQLCDRIGVMVGGRLRNVFSKDYFDRAKNPLIHLVIGRLSSDQRRGLEGLVSSVVNEGEQHVISISPPSLSAVAQYLADASVDIIASREKFLSLEDVFMQTVEENL